MLYSRVKKLEGLGTKNKENGFSIIGIIEILTDSKNPTDYFKKMRKRDKEIGSYIGTNCPHVEMAGYNGKRRKTLAGDTEQVLRIIQSIPSPKAEPFKLWLSKVGYESNQEIQDSEKSINRARKNWKRLGRPKGRVGIFSNLQGGTCQRKNKIFILMTVRSAKR